MTQGNRTRQPSSRSVAFWWPLTAVPTAHVQFAKSSLRDRPGHPTGISSLEEPRGREESAAENPAACWGRACRRHVVAGKRELRPTEASRRTARSMICAEQCNEAKPRNDQSCRETSAPHEACSARSARGGGR